MLDTLSKCPDKRPIAQRLWRLNVVPYGIEGRIQFLGGSNNKWISRARIVSTFRAYVLVSKYWGNP